MAGAGRSNAPPRRRCTAEAAAERRRTSHVPRAREVIRCNSAVPSICIEAGSNHKGFGFDSDVGRNMQVMKDKMSDWVRESFSCLDTDGLGTGPSQGDKFRDEDENLFCEEDVTCGEPEPGPFASSLLRSFTSASPLFQHYCVACFVLGMSFPVSLSILILLFAGRICSDQVQDRIWGTYKKCPDWIRSELVCDPEELLSKEVRQDLRNRLSAIQVATPCICSDKQNCIRANDASVSFLAGALIVDELTDDESLQEETAHAIYRDANLGGECDNGLLILYDARNHQVFTYVGSTTKLALSADQIELKQWQLEATEKASILKTGDDNPLLGLVQSYERQLGKGLGLKVLAWPTIVGMVVAAVIAAVAAAFLLALCCDRICGKTKRDQEFKAKKDVEEFSRENREIEDFSFKQSQEPLYVVSEPGGSLYSGTTGHIQSIRPKSPEPISPDFRPRETQRRKIDFTSDGSPERSSESQ